MSVRLDVHAHAFHPKIAPKVIAQLGDHYGIAAVGDGLVQDLLARVRRAGLDGVVVHTAATAPAQVIPANNWALSLLRDHPEITPFGTLHPGFEDWEAELEKLRRAGVRGLKFHPEFQGFWMDDPRLHPMLEAAEDDFVFMFHVGDALPPDKNPSCPFKLAALHKRFPRARMIAAHFGGYLHWEWSLETLAGTGVYMDTSSSLAFMDDATLRAIVAKHPRERLLFGSDYPLFDPGDELDRLRSRLGITEAEVEALTTNAAALLHLA